MGTDTLTGPRADQHAATSSRQVGWPLYVVPVLFLAAIAPAWFAHSVFEEYDGVMQLWAGQQLLEGATSWGTHYWPPLYGLLLAAGDWAGSAFVAGKAVSLVAALATLMAVGRIGRALGGTAVAAASQALVAVLPLFVIGSIQVENHMLEVAFIAWAVAVLFGGDSVRRYALAGALIGAAGLVRYSAYPTLAVPVVLALVGRDDAWKKIGAVLAGFVAVSAPWWLTAVVVGAEPWQHVNAARGIIGAPHEWDREYGSLWELIAHHPRGYVASMLSNLREYVTGIGWWWTLSVGAIGMFGALTDRVKGWPVAAGAVVATVAAAQAMVVPAALLAWMVLLVPFAAAAAVRGSRRFWWLAPASGIAAALIVAMLATTTVAQVRGYLAGEDWDNGQLVGHDLVAEYIRGQDADPVVMSIHPARGLFVDGQWMAPNELHLVRGYGGPVGPRDGLYVVRHTPDGTNCAGWLVVDPFLRERAPGLAVDAVDAPAVTVGQVDVYDLRSTCP